MTRRPLPVGVDDFEKLRKEQYYYIDKTLFIKDLLDMRERPILLSVRGVLGRR